MSNILHVVNSFDPAADVVRCVTELNKYSRHQHRLLVMEPHPFQDIYQYPQADNVAPSRDMVEAHLKWSDAVIYQFVGWERGYGLRTDKPCAFRNINIYWSPETDKFWSAPQYNAESLDVYKLLASSHMGARDFLPGCRWLPDLIPIYDLVYTHRFGKRKPCVSYIKHAAELDEVYLEIKRQNLLGTPHAELLRRRRTEATVVIDNVCDGHYGLAGLEAMSMGLPTVVFNHDKTRKALSDPFEEYPPFIEVGPSIYEAIEAAVNHSDDMELRKASRAWMGTFYNPQRIIDKYWEPFVEELLA